MFMCAYNIRFFSFFRLSSNNNFRTVEISRKIRNTFEVTTFSTSSPHNFRHSTDLLLFHRYIGPSIYAGESEMVKKNKRNDSKGGYRRGDGGKKSHSRILFAVCTLFTANTVTYMMYTRISLWKIVRLENMLCQIRLVKR